MRPTMTKVLVLGVGDVQLADQGVGVHAMRYLRAHYDLPGTTYIEAATLSPALAADIAAADSMIIFNAAQINGDPGTIRVLEDDEVDLAALMSGIALEGKWPTPIATISVQPGQPASGASLSETVRRSMPRAAGNAATLIHRWRRRESVYSTGLHSLPNSV